MYTTAQVLSLQDSTKPVITKNIYKSKTRANPQSNKKLDYSRVKVKVNGHPVLALVDLLTSSRDLINAQIVHLYALPSYRIEKKSLYTAIKGSYPMIEKVCDVQIDYRRYTKTRTFYIAHLAGWDKILDNLVITVLRTLIPAGPKAVTIQPEEMVCFALKECIKGGLASRQVTSAALSIEDEVLDYLLPVCKFMVSDMNLGERLEFNLLVEITQLVPATISNELLSLRTINHQICPKHGSV